jgi:ATP-dependent phosphofructokinase / diphosphate-dependent phosphofructokinase
MRSTDRQRGDEMIKRIGVMTSGGDCAGLNAAIRAIVLHADTLGWEVIGIEDGTHGLLDRPVRARRLRVDEFDGSLLRRAGTILGAVSTGDPFAFKMPDGSVADVSQRILDGMAGLKIDALIGIGGDGSFRILDRLTRQGGIPFVGVPKTIDNDVPGTDASIGFHTAVEVAVEALDRLQPTAQSHHRVMVLEVMGRDAGHIAIHTAVAGGADVCLIPEIGYSLDGIASKLQAVKDTGRAFALVIVAEAVKTDTGEPVAHRKPDGGIRYGGIGQWLAERIEVATGADARVTVLGHVQRGAEPVAVDRVIASALGVHAVGLIAAGRTGRVAVWSRRTVSDLPIEDVVGQTRPVEHDDVLVRTALGLGIYLGDLRT